MEQKITWKQILLLQAVIVIYTISSVMAKLASTGGTLSRVVLFFGLDLFCLGVYAILWQQMIKRFDLSVAYANRALALAWSAVWALLIFGEKISRKQMLGICVVLVGTVIINTEKRETLGEEKEHAE